MRKIIFLSTSFILLGILLIAYRMYNKPHQNIEESSPNTTVSAAELFDLFEQNEDSAMVAFSDQILLVEGLLLNKDLSNALEPQLLLATNADNGFIRCGFKPDQLPRLEMLQDSSIIQIKGLCKGLNGDDELSLLLDKDVILSSSIIIP